jgi:predicted anti-sigma-YlaC factor YlaD
VPQQQRTEFESMLGRALQFDVNHAPANRLSNLVMQRRARWLLAHADELFVE